MTDRKVWFITGAGRGMGLDFARAALAAGNAIVASGRDRDTSGRWPVERLALREAGRHEPPDAEAAVWIAVDRFAASRAAQQRGGALRGLLEADARWSGSRRRALIGPMNVPERFLPVMGSAQGALSRSPRRRPPVGSGTAYAASKFGPWLMESPQAEVAPFGIADHQPGVLPHGAPHKAIDELRRAVHRGLR
jgi:hypothetical protein